MGGRGASAGINGKSGKDAGISVTANGEKTDYFFTTKDGVNYYQRGVSGTPEPMPLNMTPSEFRERVTASGATVEGITAAQRKKAEAEYKKQREKANKDLDKDWYKAAPKPRKGMKGH